MRQTYRPLVTALILSVILSSAAWCEFNVNLNVGVPAPRVVVAAEAPEFIMPPSLGFYVSVGGPDNLYQVNNVYYLYRGDAWYSGPYYNGPWRVIRHRQLPECIRRHRHEEIVRIRDEECRHYREHREGYHGRHFKPDKAWKEERKEERREERGFEHEKGHHGHGHHGH